MEHDAAPSSISRLHQTPILRTAICRCFAWTWSRQSVLERPKTPLVRYTRPSCPSPGPVKSSMTTIVTSDQLHSTAFICHCYGSPFLFVFLGSWLARTVNATPVEKVSLRPPASDGYHIHGLISGHDCVVLA
ncbi:hypothetical protein LZ31DRAFT_239341 [Colletotrichum somersetense]|nr:hypothetical protein LZ31DRAFT_239341 [Colletotrichum somersetense]